MLGGWGGVGWGGGWGGVLRRAAQFVAAFEAALLRLIHGAHRPPHAAVAVAARCRRRPLPSPGAVIGARARSARPETLTMRPLS